MVLHFVMALIAILQCEVTSRGDYDMNRGGKSLQTLSARELDVFSHFKIVMEAPFEVEVHFD